MVRAFAVPWTVVAAFPRGLYGLHSLTGPPWTRTVPVGQLWVPRTVPIPRPWTWRGSCTRGDGYFGVRPDGTHHTVAVAYIDAGVLLSLRWVDDTCTANTVTVRRAFFGNTPRGNEPFSPPPSPTPPL